MNIFSESGSEAEDLAEYEKVAHIVAADGFKCYKMVFVIWTKLVFTIRAKLAFVIWAKLAFVIRAKLAFVIWAKLQPLCASFTDCFGYFFWMQSPKLKN